MSLSLRPLFAAQSCILGRKYIFPQLAAPIFFDKGPRDFKSTILIERGYHRFAGI